MAATPIRPRDLFEIRPNDQTTIDAIIEAINEQIHRFVMHSALGPARGSTTTYNTIRYVVGLDAADDLIDYVLTIFQEYWEIHRGCD